MDEVVRIARAWIGTPYRHQASCKGAGTDCLGLIRGVWRELIGEEPAAPPPYSADWMETRGEERLWREAERWLEPATRAAAGDVLLFRMDAAGPAKHLAIAADAAPNTIIHAYSGRAVIESPLTPGWARRVVARFRFPRKG